MALILPRRFAQQPQYPAKPSNKFPGLVGLWNFSNDINAITGKASTRSTAAKKSFYTSGINEEVTGTSVANRYALENIPSPGANDFTVAIQFTPKNAGGYAALGKYTIGNVNASEWFIGAGASFGNQYAGFSVSVGGNLYPATISGTSWTLNNEYILIGRRRGTTLFFDRYNLTTGAHDSATTTDAGITTINSTSTPLVLGELSGSTGYNTDMATPWAAIFNRSISNAEVAAIANNPWSLFNAPALNIWPYSAGSSDVTGTGAATQQLNSTAATGSVGVSGASSSTQSLNTSVGTGGDLDNGTGAATQQPNTTTASGLVAITGAGAATQQINTTSASGLVATTGTGAVTQQVNTTAASASIAIASAGASTQQPNTAVTTGSSTSTAIGASVQQPNVETASGSVAIACTGASTQSLNSASASGNVVGGTDIYGTGVATQSANTSAGVGSVAISCTSAVSQALNLSSSTGAILVAGVGSGVQAGNISTGAGTSGYDQITGVGASTQSQGSSSGLGAVAISGALTETQAANFSFGNGTTAIQGAGAGVQSMNTAHGSGLSTELVVYAEVIRLRSHLNTTIRLRSQINTELI